MKIIINNHNLEVLIKEKSFATLTRKQNAR